MFLALPGNRSSEETHTNFVEPKQNNDNLSRTECLTVPTANISTTNENLIRHAISSGRGTEDCRTN